MSRHLVVRRALTIVCALAVGVFGIVAAASAAGHAESAKKVRIALFGPAANTYVAATYKGMKSVADKEGATITRVDSGFDASKQYNQIQDAITSKQFDAFVIIPLDAVGLVPVVKQAIAAHIAVVNTDLALGPNQSTFKPQVPGETGVVIDPPTLRGTWLGQLIVQACKGFDPCKVGFIAGVAALPLEKAVIYKVNEILARNPSIKLVSYQDGGNYLAAGGFSVAQNMLQAHRDLNVLVSSSDQMGEGALLAVHDSGLEGKVRLVASGGSCPGVKNVEDGKWFGTVISFPYDEGVLGAKLAIDGARGAKTSKGMSAGLASHRNPILTKANLAGFKCQWQG